MGFELKETIFVQNKLSFSSIPLVVVDIYGRPPDVITLGHLKNNGLGHHIVNSSVVGGQEDGQPRGKDESAGYVLDHRPNGSSVKAEVIGGDNLNHALLCC